MEYAEAYLKLMIKPSGNENVVEGDALGKGFENEIDLSGWSWNLANEKRAAKVKNYDGRTKMLDPRRKVSEQKRLTDRLEVYAKEGKTSLVAATRQKLDSLNKSALPGGDRGPEDDSEQGNPLKFSFSKLVDSATWRMLEMMKTGTTFALARVSLVHRAGVRPDSPLYLKLEFTDLLLTSYQLQSQQDEINTDLNEQWEAEFKTVSFSYTPRWDDPTAPQQCAPFEMNPRPA